MPRRLLGNNQHCHPVLSLHLRVRVVHLRDRGDLPLVALGEDPRWEDRRLEWVRRHP